MQEKSSRSEIKIVKLHGCRPLPLAHYLKALGILRILGEQADDTAAGRWVHDEFEVASVFDQQAMVDFLLTRYSPTPVLAPWNGGSGFFRKDNTEAIEAIARGKASRLTPYREVIVGSPSSPESRTKGETGCREQIKASARLSERIPRLHPGLAGCRLRPFRRGREVPAPARDGRE